MTKTKRTSRQPSSLAGGQSFDGVYLFKMLLYLLLGSVWIKANHGLNVNIPVPIGFMLGLLFTTHEHFQIDRKLEYVVLLVSMLIGYFAPFGLYISF